MDEKFFATLYISSCSVSVGSFYSFESVPLLYCVIYPVIYVKIYFDVQAHGEDARAIKTCLYCLTVLPSLSDYDEHVSMEHSFSCICQQRFISKTCLEKHQESTHGSSMPSFPGGSGPHTCPLCLLSFSTDSKMEKHQQMNHKYVCHELGCETRFASRVKLEEHTENIHNKSLDHTKHKICPICGQVKIYSRKSGDYFSFFQRFTRPENLRKHRKKPHVYQCELCNKSFTKLDKKEQHSILVHEVIYEL